MIEKAAVAAALEAEGLRVLSDAFERGSQGLKIAQMKDATLVAVSAPDPATAKQMRDRVRSALQGRGYMTKDSAEAGSIIYVIGELDD